MKKILLFILLASLSNIIKAQDTLALRSGINIPVKIIEVGTSEVKYKKLDNLNGPNFSILKSDLSMIRYENGTKEEFKEAGKTIQKSKATKVAVGVAKGVAAGFGLLIAIGVIGLLSLIISTTRH
jgi:hypothetical protein